MNYLRGAGEETFHLKLYISLEFSAAILYAKGFQLLYLSVWVIITFIVQTDENKPK